MSDGARTSILIVDDDRHSQRLISRYLTNDGFDVICAPSGAAALRLLEEVVPDLILLDVVMPEMDGYELCARLQESEDAAFIPVIFVTSLDDEPDKARAFAVGAADYLVKPIRKQELLGKVRSHLETRSRWYQVRVSTELWDDAPLPEKFAQFRHSLVSRLNPDAQTVERLNEIPGSQVYAFTQYLDLTDSDLAASMAGFFGLTYVPALDSRSIQLGVLPMVFCRRHHVVAIWEEGGTNALVISNPFDWSLEELDILNYAFRGEAYRLLVAQEKTIASLFFDQAAREAAPEAGSQTTDGNDLTVDGGLVSWGPPVQILNSLIADAVRKGASDLHLEPAKSRVRVRYRIDGRLRSVIPLQQSLVRTIVGRIKIMCGMDVSESRKPQDGSCRVQVDGQEIEVRASTLPGTHGEIVVLRLLSGNVAHHRVETLGMEPAMLRDFRHLLAARQGMLLITGPTGSGKTSTLYAALKYLNTDQVNIVTVEDPVEVDLDGINQVQVHDRAGRSFPGTLRAMLRQDPDILMVGEIRDVETAEIACRAALTGHLVLSTLHTGHTLGTVARLFDMGMPPYLVASALNGVVAQRLVRRVCESCAREYDPPAGLKRALEAQFGSLDGARFRIGKGCGRCHHSGTSGRLGVFELLVFDEDLRHLMAQGTAPSLLKEHVMKRGFRTMELDAFHKACRGTIPPEEIVNLGLGLSFTMLEMDEPERLPAPSPDQAVHDAE